MEDKIRKAEDKLESLVGPKHRYNREYLIGIIDGLLWANGGIDPIEAGGFDESD